MLQSTDLQAVVIMVQIEAQTLGNITEENLRSNFLKGS